METSSGGERQKSLGKEDGRCQSKKTNCPFRMKFVQRPGEYEPYLFFEAHHTHNHELMITKNADYPLLNSSSLKNSNGLYNLNQFQTQQM